MNFRKEQTEEYYLLDTPVSNIFIDEYMSSAPGDYVKVYLFAYMYSDINIYIDNNDMAKHLNMEIEEVLKAWNHWEDAGVIRKHFADATKPLEYDIEFLDLRSMTYGNKSKNVDGVASKRFQDVLAEEDIAELYNCVEKSLGRMLKGDEAQQVAVLIDSYGMPLDVIEYAFKYAKQNWKGVSINAVRSLLREWSEKGIGTLEDVNEYLEHNGKRQHEYKQIMQAAGKPFNITPDEKATMDLWMDDWGYEVSEIVDKFKVAQGRNNPFSYVKAVIKNEHEKGEDPKLNTSFTNDVFGYYEKIREQKEAEAEKRRNEAYARFPKLKELDQIINKLGFEIPKIMLSQADNAEEKIADLNREIDILQADKKNILKAAGFSENHMEIQYLCMTCKDTGIMDDGSRCACFVKRMGELRS